jgi:MFS transporter, PAT family, beta-lactamase induction signal transducer AmpG
MKTLKALLQKNMLVALLMGFSAGLPLLLVGKTLQIWMTEAAVDLKTIGFFALAGLPYTLKFVWAPVFDRYTLPFLGRRRGWLMVTQILLLTSIALMAMLNPQDNLMMMAAMCVVVSFFSASQDIVIDAYRRENLKDEELGIGSTFYIYGYHTALWVTGGLALFMAEAMSWPMVYLVMAGIMIVGILTTLFATEPEADPDATKTMLAAVRDPLVDFFRRREVWAIIAFILLYKIGDTLAGGMANPFYIKLGFQKAEIGAIVKTFGFFATLGGGLLGGLTILKLGVNRSLMVFGILQMVSTAGFAVLADHGPSLMGLTWVIAFENLTSGMGTAAFVAFMGQHSKRAFSATQFALLTSLMGVPRTIFASYTGVMAEALGWQSFFWTCTFAAIPGLVLLAYMLNKERRAAPHPTMTVASNLG